MDNEFNNFSTENYDEAGCNTIPTGFVTYIPYGFTPETYRERNDLRKAALIIGLSMLALMGILFFWATIVYFVADRLGISSNEIQKFLSDPAIGQVLQVILSIITFTLPFIAIFKIGGERISDLVPLEKPKKGNRLSMFLIGVSFCGFANIASSYMGQIFSGFGIDYNVDYGENPEGFFGFLLSLLAMAIVPALVEEFACRGLVLGLLRKFGDGFAIIVSSILFGLMHGNFDQIPFAFAVGLVLGFITVKTNSLWIAVAVHCANNCISVFFTYFFDSVPAMVENLIYTVYLMAILIIGVVFAVKSENDIFTIEKSKTASGFGKKFKWFFSSATIIIFTVFCILESFIYFF